MSKDHRCLSQPQRRLGPGRRRSRAATAAAVAIASILPSLLVAATVSVAAATLPPGAALPPAHADLLQPPALSPGAQRAEMTPLVEDGHLAGAVWLEGSDRASFAVLYAAWKGTTWGTPRIVSAGSSGSQLALTTARLADGSWMLAWSAFDGHDDEIVWSQGRAGVWTAPHRLTDNPVPDITPTVAAAGSGALIAWNQLAGDGYRLVVSRFEGDSATWGAPAAVTAGGALYPTFVASPRADRLRLVYSAVRDGEPARWEALETDLDGHPMRQTVLPSAAVSASEAAALLAPAGAAAGADLDWTPWNAPAEAPALSDAMTAALGLAAKAAAPGSKVGSRAARPKAGPAVYIAFGDSITSGYGDTEGIGYPGRLQGLLTPQAGSPATVINAGFFGETTAGGLARINSVLAQNPGATGLLLMEGTNDVNARVSNATIVQNLDMISNRAEAQGLKVYLGTVIPRLHTADYDGANLVTGTLAGAIRELAWERARALVDPFEVFWVLTPNALTLDYQGGSDKLHPNDAGYTLLAHTFADVLNGVDNIPPVPGLLTPFPGQVNVLPSIGVQVVLYDFGAGIDVANTQLTINGQVVNVTPTGDKTRLQFLYTPTTPFVGVVNVGVNTKDLASPANSFDGTLIQFIIEGTTFLPGDFNRDGVVDGEDLLALAYAFGAHRYDVRFSLPLDLNGDGIIDGLDLAIVAKNFGKHSF
jgi:lysophospholipase L1-like esterase